MNIYIPYITRLGELPALWQIIVPDYDMMQATRENMFADLYHANDFLNEETHTYAPARKAMVQSQIHPMGVTRTDLLEAYENIAREQFVPLHMSGICYADTHLKIDRDRVLLAPCDHARLVDALHIRKDTRVLDVGGNYGYSAAILASLAHNVTALETDADWHNQALAGWLAHGLQDRIKPRTGALRLGCTENAPYDAILMNGGAFFDPVSLTSQLAPEGRLVCYKNHRDRPGGHAVIFEKSSTGVLSSRILFDGSAPYLPGFEAPNVFVF